MMLSVKNKDRLSIAGIVFFFLGISTALTDYFVDSNSHSLGLIFVSIVALFTSIRILSINNLPILKQLVGFSLTIALFAQAYFSESLLSAVLGLVMFFTSAAEYRKDSARTG